MTNISGSNNKNDTLTGTSGNDKIAGLLGDDTLYGGGGDDILYGDMKIGDETKESLYAYKSTSGDDKIYGGDGNDTIYDYYGKDENHSHNVIYGGDGNDTIYGSGTLYGDRGDDYLFLWNNGIVMAGKGNDTIDGTGSLSGNDGNDTIRGSGILKGGNGNDRITTTGDATAYGGNGNDVLLSTSDNVSLWGNYGNDVFKFGITGVEVHIEDFRIGQDKINLSSLSSEGLLDGLPKITQDGDGWQTIQVNYYIGLDNLMDHHTIHVHEVENHTLTTSDFIF
jgi:Ca2+-binding RTX toxin-like protein